MTERDWKTEGGDGRERLYFSIKENEKGRGWLWGVGQHLAPV